MYKYCLNLLIKRYEISSEGINSVNYREPDLVNEDRLPDYALAMKVDAERRPIVVTYYGAMTKEQLIDWRGHSEPKQGTPDYYSILRPNFRLSTLLELLASIDRI